MATEAGRAAALKAGQATSGLETVKEAAAAAADLDVEKHGGGGKAGTESSGWFGTVRAGERGERRKCTVVVWKGMLPFADIRSEIKERVVGFIPASHQRTEESVVKSFACFLEGGDGRCVMCAFRNGRHQHQHQWQ